MTYREQREAKAERLRGWADKRTTDAAAVFKSHERYQGDTAFNTQPGHIPKRARVIAQADRAYQSLGKADRMASTAGGIEHQLDTSIYSDDEDAVERLEERIEGLEAKRETIKLINKAARKYKTPEEFAKALAARQLGDIEISEATALGLAHCANTWGGKFRPGYDAYVLSNLSGDIGRQKKRLEQLKRDGGPPAKYLLLRYTGACKDCGKVLEKGTEAIYQRPELRCMDCWRAKKVTE